jgi:hypothetical protein
MDPAPDRKRQLTWKSFLQAHWGVLASVSIEDGAMLAGDFPAKQLRMVQVWIDIHKEELLADWELAATGQEPFRIAPLQ